MKRKLQSSPSILHAGLIAMIAACCVLIFPTRGFAQNDTVTISAAEFQRIVYSAHLLTQLDARPELDASLQVLLELQRRNPHADPVALARLLEQTTVQYSNTAPAYIRTRAFRDEILATYLEGMRQVPSRTNFISANLTLLKKMAVLEDTPYTNQNQQAYLFHTGSRRLLSAGQVAAQQEELVDLCTRRGQANPVFRTAMDSLLAPVIGVWLTNRPAEILLVNPALSNTPSMQLMAYQSSLNADGSVRLSTSVLKNLFAEEMHNMHGIINTNLALHLAILESQTDLTSYLTNRLLMAQNSQRESEIKKGQQERLSGASASVQALGQVLDKNQPDVANTIKTVGAALHDIGESMDFLKESTGLLKAAAAGGLVAAGLELATLLIDMGPTPEDLVMDEIGQVKSLIRDLSANVNYRFDRVDQSFEQVLEAVAETVNRIDGVAHDVNQARQSLLSIQSDLHSLERSLFDYVSDGFRQELVRHINSGLDYERWWGEPMGYVGGSEYCYQNNETEFYSWSAGPLAFCKASYSSPFAFDLSESRLFAELHGRPLESSLNYINQFCATNLNVALASNTRLANPRDWYLAAQSYLQLALEQPLFFRKAGLHLPDVIATGNEVADFCRNLSFRAGTNVNWELFAALTNHYRTKLNSFGAQLRAAEQKSATARGFSVDSWRWPLSAPKVAAASTEVLESGHPRPTVPAEVVAAATRTRPVFAVAGDANYSHGLVVQTGGTAVAWGADSYRYNVVPDGLSNVVAVAVGFEHNLALRSDGTVVNWGSPGYDKSICPALATNVTFISAGKDHSLAVRADGRVVGWGYNYYGQATGVPPTGDYHGGQGLVSVGKQVLTNAVAAAGGWNYSLALKADGRIVAWGSGSSGETNVPPDLSDVMTIAAGGFHALAARSNGTVVAWGLNHLGQTNVPPGLSNVVAVTAGTSHSLALRSDGTVVAWGSNEYGQTNVPPDLSNVVAIAADDHSSLALREDGSFVLWGSNGWLWNGPIPIPAGLTNVVAVDGGDFHILALRADGTVAGWGATQGDYGQSRIPDGLSNVVAIAAGDYHSLALRSDGTVAAWGNSNNGQSKVPDGLKNVVAITGGREFSAVLKSDGTVETWGINIGAKPANLTNIVAISAGESYFCLALTANGRVRAWGDSSYGQCGVPAGLTNVVAISAGSTHSLALRADGTVVVWGGNGSSWTVVPSGLSNVVAIAAGSGVSVALKADGTATAWGGNSSGESNVPQEADNIVAIGAGYRFSLYVQANTAGQGNSLLVARSSIPLRVRDHLYAVNAEVLTNLNLDLNASAVDLSGSKALLQAVLSLAMPYTLESDDILHGYFYGTEQLMDLATARQLYSREMASLSTIGYLPGLRSDQVAEARFSCFRDRLWTRLQDLAQTGQPEIPRIVGHTLRLLNLLQDAWPAVPPPAVEMSIEANSYRLLLFGEPYVRYALQEANNLNPPDWTTVTPTNWLSEESLLRNYSTVPKAFYRAVLPVP